MNEESKTYRKIFNINFRMKETNESVKQDCHPFNLHPEKWFEEYPVKSTHLKFCHLISKKEVLGVKDIRRKLSKYGLTRN